MRSKTSMHLLLIFLTSVSLSGQTFEDQIHQLLADYFEPTEPGGAVLIKKYDKIVFTKGYGVADLETGDVITPETVFNTGSISKTFVANAILILHEQGKLNIQDPITKYFTFAHPKVVKSVKIIHFLSHTSGLPDLRDVASHRTDFLTARDQENFQPLLDVTKLNFPAGSQFEYSNPAYNGLALIIEKVTGMKWQHFVRENIFLASDMPTSKVTDGPHPEQGVAHAYDRKGRSWLENDYGEFPTFAAAGNGGIWSSVLELANYENAIKNRVFLPENTVRQSRTPVQFPQWKSSENPHIGYAWWIGEGVLFPTKPFNKKMIFHTGSQGGFRGYHLVIPDEDLLIVGLFNRPIERRIIRQIVTLVADYDWLN